MGRWGDRLRVVFGGKPRTFDSPTVIRFSGNPGPLPVDQLLTYMANRQGRIDRENALKVPAVLKGRNMICSISTLPLEAVNQQNRVVDRPLFGQFDPNVPNVVHIAMTVEDLLFEGVAWWRVVGFGPDGYPSRVQRYEPRQVSLQPPPGYQRGYLPSGLPTEGVVWMEGKPVPFDEVIRFDSPNPAILVAGEDAIRRARLLNDAAELYAASPRRRGFFTPTDGYDPADDGAIEEALEAWQTASSQRVDGYVPAALAYTAIQDSTPAELQLVQMKKDVTLELANMLGVDPEDLGQSTTSRTYQNGTDRRRDRINDVLAPYMDAITGRLGMPDVTPDGQRVRFKLDDYLRADPKTRAEVQQIYYTMGSTDAAEIRDEEGKPPRTVEAPAAAPSPPVDRPRRVPSTTGAALEGESSHTFTATAPGMTFDEPITDGFSVDDEARTVTGLLVPWGQYARSGGRLFRFAPGSVVWSAVNRVKLLRDHDNSSAFGRATRLWSDERGLWGTFKVAPGRRGDEALALALDGVLDGFSVGVDMTDQDLEPDPQRDGAWLVHRAAMRETSMTAVPSFDDSRLTSVRAAREGEASVNCEHCGAPITPGVAHVCATPPTNTPPADTATAPVTFSGEQFETFMARLVPSAVEGPPAVRPTVNPTTRPVAGAQVNESLPYRFSRQSGRTVFASDVDHDFSTDLFAVLRHRSGEGGSAIEVGAAQQRIDAMIGAAFAARSTTAMFADVENADVTALNPNRHRPDMWQPQMDYVTPLWDMVDSGTTDGTKFDVPKFTSSSGLVVAATEKTEPAGGSFVAELQTITPTQVWGKVEVTRQSWRAGGNPALSGILWDQMLREYYEDREAAVATFLATLTAATDLTITGTPASSPTNDHDQASVASFSAAQADLQFVRGGNRFRAFAVHQDLYRMFSRVTDDAGRPLFPILAPSNANGTTQSLFRTIDINGTLAVPSWALGAGGQTTAQNSWLFDPAVVRGWASAPERMFWDFGATVQTANIPQLSFVTLGIYGDVAFANLNIAGVRQVIFDASV